MCLDQSLPVFQTWWQLHKMGSYTPPSISLSRGPCSSAAGWAMVLTAVSTHHSNSSWQSS